MLVIRKVSTHRPGGRTTQTICAENDFIPAENTGLATHTELWRR